MNCRVYPTSSSEMLWARQSNGGGGGGMSHESEHDLGMMVNDFLENGNSGGRGADSRYSSDSDSSLSNLLQLADKISYYKVARDQYENDLLSVTNSLALSISEKDLHAANSGMCKASCIRFSLVKLLRMSGYDAGLCTSKWQGNDKVPGGDHEYIDVVRDVTGGSERVVIDIDFRSHFEIARAVASYDRILNSLPVIYVGSFAKLKQFLQVMAEAARSSLKQNSMPLPPWRSLAYLQAKWHSPYQRKFDSAEQNCNTSTAPADHKKCAGHLKRLHSLLLSEIEVERTLKPYNRDRKVKTERRRYLNFH